MPTPSLRLVLVLSVLAAAAALGGAMAAERWGGVVPCALCLIERWPYMAAIGLGLAGLLLPRAPARLALGLLAAVVLAGGAVAALHVGVEAHWWPSPLPECAAPRMAGGSVAERLARMPERPAKPCDEPTYLLPGLPVSTAGLNLAFALALGGSVATWLWRSRRSPP